MVVDDDAGSDRSASPPAVDAVGRGGSGIVFNEPHFPGRPPIDAYGAGGFRFSGASHRGALLCLPSGVYGWNVDAASFYSDEAFVRIFQEADLIEVLLLGTGDGIVRVPTELHQRLRELGIMSDPMATGAAVRTFNVLLSEGRAVAAALLPVDVA